MNRIAAILLGSAETTFVVSALLLGQYALGWVFVRLPRMRTPNTIAFNIAAGLAVTTGICWYAHATQGTLQGALPAIATCSFVALSFLPILEARSVDDGDGGRLCDSPLTGGIVTLLCILFAVSIFYHAISPTGETVAVVLGNNDTYAWALAADRIRSVVSDIHGATPFWQRVLPDAGGTQQILALLARIRGTTAFEALPYFHVTVTSLICLATYELCLTMSRLKALLSFLVALGTSTSTFYFYIYLDGFFGELVGTFGALAGIGAAWWGFGLVGSAPRRLVTRVFAIAFPTALIFTSYQAGFLPFAVLILCTSGAIVFAVNRRRGFRAAFSSVLENTVAPTLLAVLAIAILFPEIADHVVSRTWTVAAAGAGWPIPIIDPRHFVGLSWFGSFGEGRGTWPYYVVFWVGGGLLALALRRGQQTEQTRANAGALAAFLGFVFLYLLAYALKGPIYQVWKLAAYTALPLGFVPLGALLVLPQADPTTQLAGSWRTFLPTAAAIVLIIMSLATWAMDGRSVSLAGLTANLRALSADVDRSAGVVLDMPPYRDTMVAMNLLHPHGPIVPLQVSAIPATALTDPVLSQPGFTVVHSAACARQRAALASELPPAPAGPDHYIAEPWAATGGGAYYAFGTSTCIGGTSFAILDAGLSGAEPWGRWSSAPEATLKLSGFSGRPLIVKIRMQPFAVGGKAKRLGVTVNGRSYGMIVTARPGILMLPVPGWLNDKPEITLAFSFPDHIKLTDLDPNSSDTRDIAFGFVDLLLTTTADETSTNPDVFRATFREFPG